MTPFVVAGGIVRNRGWILERHLGAVAINSNTMTAFYVTGDNSDDTVSVLDKFSSHVFYRHPDPNLPSGRRDHHMDLHYLVHDTGEPGYTRDGSDGPRYNSAHMSRERNLWAQEAIERWPHLTHLWVVDSDVIPAPDVLGRLLALKCAVAGAYVPIADGINPIHMMGWDGEKPRRTLDEKIIARPHIASLVGGCYLIDVRKMRVLDVVDDLWGEHVLGEDGYLASVTRNLGEVMMADPLAKCQHLMRKDR